MPHRPRQKARSGMYHIYVHGISNEQIFNETREKNKFKEFIRKYEKEFQVEIYAYCIMSNHSHLIIKSESEELSSFMAKVLSKYANYYNYKHNRRGHVFRNRFGSECIETEKYMLNCIRYVHMNPVKACMAPLITDYEYSSIKEYRRGKVDILHENAIKYYKLKFKDWSSFFEFHHLPGEVVFMDSPEEIFEQLRDQAMLLLWEFQEVNKFENAVEVFEDSELREKYKGELAKRMDISAAKSNKLFDELKRKMIG